MIIKARGCNAYRIDLEPHEDFIIARDTGPVSIVGIVQPAGGNTYFHGCTPGSREVQFIIPLDEAPQEALPSTIAQAIRRVAELQAHVNRLVEAF